MSSHCRSPDGDLSIRSTGRSRLVAQNWPTPFTERIPDFGGFLVKADSKAARAVTIRRTASDAERHRPRALRRITASDVSGVLYNQHLDCAT